MAGKLEIQWSPNKNKFITWGTEVCLYEIEPLKDQQNAAPRMLFKNGDMFFLSLTNYFQF